MDDKSLKENQPSMYNVGQNSHLTVNEATVLNQIINDIETGNYPPEQYGNLIGNHIKQHPTLKKKGSLVKTRTRRKLLNYLQKYLATRNNFEKEGNEDQLTEDPASVKSTLDFHAGNFFCCPLHWCTFLYSSA